jgi:hypothetical protein
MSDDIVARLREIPNGIGGYFYKTTQQAADEIERLRDALRIEREECAACAIDRKETQRERDDARREVCEWVSLQTKRSPRVIALNRGWNCYEKHDDEETTTT